MPVSEFLEDLVSQIPALHLLQQMGYKYLTPIESLRSRGGKRSKVILENVLEGQLREINKIGFKGNTYDFTDGNIKDAIEAITSVQYDGLVASNEVVFDLLTLGKSLEQTIDGNRKSFTIQYIDWDSPSNNVFHISDEFEVERTASHETRRPDIVLFVNGIPFVVIECKRPDLKDALEQGISQHLRNQRSDEIPHLFIYSQLLISICQNRAKFGTAGTPKKFWAIWKEENDDELNSKVHKLINSPLSSEQQDRVFESRQPKMVSRAKQILSAGERAPSPQDLFLYSLLRPERFARTDLSFHRIRQEHQKGCPLPAVLCRRRNA